MKLVYVLLALILVKSIVLYKVYASVTPNELKRRARLNDKKATKLYQAAAYEPSLELVLWLSAVASGTVLFIWSARIHWWWAAVVVIVSAWLTTWSRFSVEGWTGSLAAMLAPFDAKLLSLLHPITGRIAGWFPPSKRLVNLHTGLYERPDLLELLNKQNKQIDNRIPDGDLEIAANSMTFGDKKVRQVMTPRRQVKMVGVDDAIGPLLMDELHKSGFSRFPVVKDSAKVTTPHVVGTLYLNNLIGYEGNGKVKDLMAKKVYFINEDSNLRQALSAFLKTHHHLLIVVNSFEEMVGVLSLEDVLEQIIGKQIVDEFDNYESLRAVAAMDAKKEQQEHKPIQPEQTATAENPQT